MLREPETHTVWVHPADPAVVLAGTADGVWRSRDRGATFARARFPDERKQIWSFLADAGNPQRIYAGGSPIDVYRSDDAGESWRRLPRPVGRCGPPARSRRGRTWQDMELKRFSPVTYGRDIKVSPQDPSTLYAALSVAAASHDGGVYRSRDAPISLESHRLAGALRRRIERGERRLVELAPHQYGGTVEDRGLHHARTHAPAWADDRLRRGLPQQRAGPVEAEVRAQPRAGILAPV